METVLGQTWFWTTGDITIVTVPPGGVATVKFGNEHNPKAQALPIRVLFTLIARFGILIANPAKILFYCIWAHRQFIALNIVTWIYIAR